MYSIIMNNIIIFMISLLFLIFLNEKNLEKFDPKGLLNETNTFPFRYLKDENNKKIPIVAITAPFRNDNDKKRYYTYINNDIKVIGVTAYKSFPKKITDTAEDKYHLKDDFNYLNELKLWLTCFDNNYIFKENQIIEMSESDFYDIDTNPSVEKKYDFIYICNKDTDKCPLNGWNAINRNFNLALKCFPIMINDYKLKGLCVGRIGCNLSNTYGDAIEETDFLNYYDLQQKMRQSKFLFVPNIYDASPRVVAECLVKGVPVLMNKSIIGGFKYINEDYTGEFFIDENDIKTSLDNLLKNLNKYDPKKWWQNNYGIEKSSIKLRNFLYKFYPDILKNIKMVSFVI